MSLMMLFGHRGTSRDGRKIGSETRQEGRSKQEGREAGRKEITKASRKDGSKRDAHKWKKNGSWEGLWERKHEGRQIEVIAGREPRMKVGRKETGREESEVKKVRVKGGEGG